MPSSDLINEKLLVRCFTVALILSCVDFSTGFAWGQNIKSESTPIYSPFSVTGFVKNETAYRLSEPNEFTKVKTLLFLEGRHRFTSDFRLKVSGRAFYDAVFALEENFPPNVKDDQEHESTLREAFLDFSYRNLDLRLGLQQIVWGEAVIFIADVVNPKDLREFLLPDFEYIRIPLWAVNASYRLREELSIEGVWTPVPRVDRYPIPGSEFAFFRPSLPDGVTVITEAEEKPTPSFNNSEVGVRLSGFAGGWDFSLFYLYTFDGAPIYFKTLSLDSTTGLPIVTISPRHPRLEIFGGGFAKTFASVVIRGEVATFLGRFLELEDPQEVPGLIQKDMIDYAVSLGYAFSQGIDLEFQFLQEIIPQGKGVLLRDPIKSLVAVRVSMETKLVPEILSIVGINDGDYQISTKLNANLTDAVIVSVGVDLFGGPHDSLYGQFAKKDRVTLTIKYRF